MGYRKAMMESIRARASLMIAGIVAFLLLLESIPRWDSGWVQAVGSILAILAGFAYVALQQNWQRREERRRQREMQEYALRLVEIIWLDAHERWVALDVALRVGHAFTTSGGRDPLDILSDELLSISPAQTGSINIALATRKAGLHAKALIFEFDRIARSGDVHSDDLESVTALRLQLEDARSHIESWMAEKSSHSSPI